LRSSSPDRYEFDGKEKLLSIGPYPHWSIADARTARDEARETLRAGRDPNIAKRVDRAKLKASDADTFEIIAREYFKLNEARWVQRHADDVITSLQRDVFSHIGEIPIREISAPMLLQLLRKIESRPAIETARRVRQRISAVFVFAIATGRAETDPAGTLKPVANRCG
jgi:integrase